MVNTPNPVETGKQDETTGELQVEQITKESIAQILFNPSNPKYKKVEDLPRVIQDHYIDFEDGFIRESAHKNYEHVKKQAKTNARAKDNVSISLKVVADDQGGTEKEDRERRERKAYILSLAQKMYNFFFYNQTKERLNKYEQDILYTQAQNFEIDSDKHIASKEKDKERRENEAELVSLLDKMEKGLNDMGVKGFVYVRGGGMDIGPAGALEGEINGRKLIIRWLDENNYYDGSIDNVKLTKTEIKDLLKKYLPIAVPMFHGGFSKEKPFLAERRGYMADIYTEDGNKYYSSSEQENLKEPLHVEEIKFIEGYERELLKSKRNKMREEILKDVI